MRGTRDFVLHIPNKYNEKYKTESGLEIYGDHRWMAKELANTIVDVVETPFNYDGPIKKGDKVFVDSTLVMQGIHKEGVIDSPFLIDRENGWYKSRLELIIAYSSDNGTTWHCSEDNILLNQVKSNGEETVNGIIRVKPQSTNNVQMEVFLSNKELIEDGIDQGTNLYVDKSLMIEVKFNGKNLVWLKNKDLFALV